MYETLIVAGLWVLFGGTHMVLSSRAVRAGLVARLGRSPFMGVYSLVAFATFIPLVMYYLSHRHSGPVLWAIALPEYVRWLLYAWIGIAFILIAASLITPSPTLVGQRTRTPAGVQLITRHALFMGIAMWALGHLLVNGIGTDVAFFGGFVVFALLGGWHQDARRIADGDSAYAGFVAATPFLPFSGRETLRGLRELSRPAIAVGIVVTFVLRVFHSTLFVA